MSFLLLILVYEVVSGDFDLLSPPHLQPKSKDLGLQAATRFGWAFMCLVITFNFGFSKNRPLADSFIESRCQFIYLYIYLYVCPTPQPVNH